MPVQLTSLENKVMDYLIEHKTPVQAETLAKRFIISRSKASTALSHLEKLGLADSISIGSKKFYKVKS